MSSCCSDEGTEERVMELMRLKKKRAMDGGCHWLRARDGA